MLLKHFDGRRTPPLFKKALESVSIESNFTIYVSSGG